VMRRVTAGLVIAALFSPAPLHATTAASLSSRIVIDGVLDEYAGDEWVLDATTTLPESDRDSGWGRDNDISRVAITWDTSFLYVGVEARLLDSVISAWISNRAGGLYSLDNAGEFRRAIQLPGLPLNLMALAVPGRIPDVARADDTHPFALVDRGAVPVAVSGVRGGSVGFEMAIPWSALSLADAVRLVTAVTGDTGTGAGDAAPDASVVFDSDRYALRVCDRQLAIHADTDGDGVPDAGVSPRTAVTIDGGSAAPVMQADTELEITPTPRAFAPDRAETVSFSYRINTESRVFLSAAVYSLGGDRVRVLFTDQERTPANGVLPVTMDDEWDGTDESGAIVRGGAYIMVVQWGYARGDHSGRSKTAVVVAR